MLMKSIAAVAFSVILGALVGSVIGSLTLPPHTVSGALHSPNLDNTLIIIIKGFFGGIYGFLTAVITLALVNNGFFSQLSIRHILVLTAAFGLINSLVFVGLEYNNAIDGLNPPVLDDFARKMIIETAVTEFVVGCLIGWISIIVVKFFSNSAD
jgi:hypothetical protein